MDQDIVKLIESTGFTEKEARIYAVLLELGRGTVTEISKLSGLKRSIIYVILEGLIKRGYVSELPEKKINVYQAADPTIILSNLHVTAKNFSEMLPVLRTLHNRGKKRPKISYHETLEGILRMYSEMSVTQDPFFMSSNVVIEKYFPKLVSTWINDYKRNKIIGRQLIPDNLQEIEIGKRFKEVNQEVRVFTGVKEFNMDLTIYKNKLAITSFEDEPFIVVIESEKLVKSMKPIFELMWKSGRDLPDLN